MTRILPKPDVSGLEPEDPARRDYTRETDWFPIFRSGDYPQGKFTAADVDEVVAEFNMHGRRSPIVNDHLSAEDFAAGRKAGASLGNVIALRAVDSTNPLYPGARELQARAKVGMYASWETREGARRNVSAGFAKVGSVIDKVKRWSLHHLALLGAAPPGVMGLPEVIFGEDLSLASQSEMLRFSTDAVIPVAAIEETGDPNKEMRVHQIAFSEHEALLKVRESELALAHSQEVSSFQEQLREKDSKIKNFEEQLEEAQAAVTAAETALGAVKAEVEVKVEAAKQEGVKEGEKVGLTNAHRMYEETRAKDSLVAFCTKLRGEGKLTETEFKGVPEAEGVVAKPPMAERLFAMPEGVRAEFSELLEARPSVKVELEKPAAITPTPKSGQTLAFQERVNIKAQSIMRSNPGVAFQDAWSQAETELTSQKED